MYAQADSNAPTTCPAEWSQLASLVSGPLPVDQFLPLPDIVLKMLEKSPDRRYQKLDGLRADLTQCWRQWQAVGEILPFAIGRHDSGGRFRTLRRLYGRDSEVGALRSAYRGIIERGASGLVLLSGPAGVGKSALVKELEQEVNARGGSFIAGKFDQYKRQMPYSTLGDALSQLLDALLGSDEQFLHGRRERLEQTLEGNGARTAQRHRQA